MAASALPDEPLVPTSAVPSSTNSPATHRSPANAPGERRRRVRGRARGAARGDGAAPGRPPTRPWAETPRRRGGRFGDASHRAGGGRTSSRRRRAAEAPLGAPPATQAPQLAGQTPPAVVFEDTQEISAEEAAIAFSQPGVLGDPETTLAPEDGAAAPEDAPGEPSADETRGAGRLAHIAAARRRSAQRQPRAAQDRRDQRAARPAVGARGLRRRRPPPSRSCGRWAGTGSTSTSTAATSAWTTAATRSSPTCGPTPACAPTAPCSWRRRRSAAPPRAAAARATAASRQRPLGRRAGRAGDAPRRRAEAARDPQQVAARAAQRRRERLVGADAGARLRLGPLRRQPTPTPLGGEPGGAATAPPGPSRSAAARGGRDARQKLSPEPLPPSGRRTSGSSGSEGQRLGRRSDGDRLVEVGHRHGHASWSCRRRPTCPSGPRVERRGELRLAHQHVVHADPVVHRDVLEALLQLLDLLLVLARPCSSCLSWLVSPSFLASLGSSRPS